MSDGPITVTVNLTSAAFEDLERSSLAEANTRTDVVNRAIGIYAAIGSAAPGEILSIADCDGVWRRVLVLPNRGWRFRWWWSS